MIKDNYDRIRKEIGNVRLIAVSKTKTIEEIKEAISAGVTDIGESYIQEAEPKMKALDGVRKHFIGHIQSNKVKKIVELFDFIQSVDRIKIAKLIDNEASKANKKMPILIQVNISGEKSKSGIKPEELDEFLIECKMMKNIEVCGLMTIGPLTDDDIQTRDAFRQMKGLSDKSGLNILSMGMTDDYMIAIEQGSNMVRIGTGLFGKR